MKRPIATITWLCAALLALPAPGAESQGVLHFATPGLDRVSGTLESLDGDRLIWKSPVLEKPAPFLLKNILEMTLPTVIPQVEGDHEATLTIVPWPEDAAVSAPTQIKGRLVAVTDERIVLDTWYAGRMEIRRSMIKSVDIEDRATLLYSGPTDMEGWVQKAGKSSWIYRNGALRGKADSVPVGRNLKLPEEVVTEFDMAWKGMLSMRFTVFADAVTGSSPDRGYQVALQGGYGNVRRINGGMGGIEQMSMPILRENEKVHVEVRASRKTGHLCLLLNSRPVLRWKDQDHGRGKLGEWVQFEAESPMSELSISRIKVSSWDGEMGDIPEIPQVGMMFGGGIRRLGGGMQADNPPKNAAKPKAEEPGRMKLRNGDSLAGEVLKIADGLMHIKTPFAEVKLPVSRVRNISLKSAELEEPIRTNGDVRAWFVDGSSLVFHLDGLDGDTITGSSQIFGKAKFKLSAFNRIDFNVHDPAVRDLRRKAGR